MGIVFSLKRHQFPANGETAEGLVLPIITRLTRSSMLDVLGQDYIRTALAAVGQHTAAEVEAGSPP